MKCDWCEELITAGEEYFHSSELDANFHDMACATPFLQNTLVCRVNEEDEEEDEDED